MCDMQQACEHEIPRIDIGAGNLRCTETVQDHLSTLRLCLWVSGDGEIAVLVGHECLKVCTCVVRKMQLHGTHHFLQGPGHFWAAGLLKL